MLSSGTIPHDVAKKILIKISMVDTPITFGDNVRVVASLEIEDAGLPGLIGKVYGHTTPSVINFDVIRDVTDDFAINVYIEEHDGSYWFVPELLEFVDHGAGTEITFNGVPKKWTRNADGNWNESSTAEPAPKRCGFLSQLFGIRDKND